MTLPKAKRMTPKQFGNQVAKAIADYDPDAASRYRRAREQRSVWTRELEDGMSYLGMVHDTSDHHRDQGHARHRRLRPTGAAAHGSGRGARDGGRRR